VNDEVSQAPADRRIPPDRAAEPDEDGSVTRRSANHQAPLADSPKLCGCGGRRFEHRDKASGGEQACSHLGYVGSENGLAAPRDVTRPICRCERYTAPIDGTPMHYVRSSNLDSSGYDGARRRLIVRFSGGAAYVYLGVPKATFDAMLDLAREHGSVGGYLAHSIKGTYPYERLQVDAC
jgi:hypothetical protein